jgi:gamma-carbonic anhydrase
MSFNQSSQISIIPFEGKSPRIHPSVLLCDGVRVIGDVEIGEDSSIWFNTVIRGDDSYIRIGKRVNIQDMCMLHVTHIRFPLVIEDDASVAHSVTLHGCTVKSGCLIGMSAIVLDGAVVGEGALVAAGALVREGQAVPPNTLFAGVPGKVIRELTDEDRERIAITAPHYVAHAAKFR